MLLLPLLTLAMLATIISVRPPPHLMRGGGAACLAGDRKDSLLLGELHELFFDPGPCTSSRRELMALRHDSQHSDRGEALAERSPSALPGPCPAEGRRDERSQRARGLENRHVWHLCCSTGSALLHAAAWKASGPIAAASSECTLASGNVARRAQAKRSARSQKRSQRTLPSARGENRVLQSANGS